MYLFFLGASFCLAGEWTVCIDGGGSKTTLEVINEKGEVVPLVKKGEATYIVMASGSNMNTVGQEKTRAALRDLFDDVWLDGRELKSILPECLVVAGMAGIALPKNKAIMASFLEEWGVQPNRLVLMSDAEMALHLLGDRGIILIAGTGSICLGKNNQMQFRIGGLGRVLGDEGSGYQIGLQAVQAGLAEEYGWGAPTKLTGSLRDHFHVSELKNLIPKINAAEMAAAQIASGAPLVFQEAENNDAVAQKILEEAAEDLKFLLVKMVEISHLSDSELHLWGGVFKSPYADRFIQKMTEGLPHLRVFNQAYYNAAVLYARKLLPKKDAADFDRADSHGELPERDKDKK